MKIQFNRTNIERAKGRKAAPECIHLEKSVDLMDEGNVPKL